MPREYTEEEVRNKFLEYIAFLIKYWDEIDSVRTQKERMKGLAFSILSMLDGCSGELPGFIVAPLPHPEDKEFRIREMEENYYPENHEIEDDIKCDIGGGLHEHFSNFRPC